MPFSIFNEAGKVLDAQGDSVDFNLRGYLEVQARAIANIIIHAYEIGLLQEEMQGRLPLGTSYLDDVQETRENIHRMTYDEALQSARFALQGKIDAQAIKRNLYRMRDQIIQGSMSARIGGHPQVKEGQYFISLFPKLAPAGKESPMRRHLSRNHPGFLAELARDAVYDSALTNRIEDGSFVDPDYIHREQHFAALIVPDEQFERFREIERDQHLYPVN